MTLTTPSINCSKYNNVSYWQVEINGIQVMRRQSDNYFNATHVLKLALYTKPTRTRIVDREIYSANITHEKVQGGYALIQGTWLTMDFTIALARKHHVLNLLLPIINIDTSLTYPERPPSSPKKLHAPRTRTEFKPVISPRPQQAVSPSKKYAHLERNTPSPFRHLLSPHLSPKVLSMKPVDLPSSLRKREIMLSILNGDDGLKVINLLREPDSDPKSFDINYAVDNDSNSALHLASNMAKIGIVKTLLDHGVNTTFCNTWGETALMTSVLQSNNYQVQTFAKLLILLHPTLYSMDARNQTVLHHIVSRCELNGYVSSAIYYLTSILEFLQTRDDIYLQQLFLDRKDDDGNTALHIATRNKLLRVSEILILMGCRMDVKDFNGKTQRDISRFDFGLRKMYQGYNSDSDGDFSDLVEENVIEVTQVQKLKFYLEANADLEVDEFTGVGIKRKLDE